jgi:hypothetical protein
MKIQPHETRFSHQAKHGWNWITITGEERILLIISKEPIDDIDDKIQRLRKSEIDRIDEIFTKANVWTLNFRHE